MDSGGKALNIIDKLREKGFDTVPADFYSKIEEWKSWYQGDVQKFHYYTVYNGQTHVRCHMYTLGMAKKVAEDWANLLMNEKVAITLEGKAEQQFFDDVCQDNNFLVKINEMQELKAGLGTAAYVLRVEDALVNEETGALMSGGNTSIQLDYVLASNIFPLSWENGIVTECAFASEKTVKNEKYIYLQIHHKANDGTYLIENSIYRNTNGQMTEVALNDVAGFENVPPLVRTGSDKPQFVIDRLDIVNNFDPSLPMGVPAFANAISCLQGVDKVYDSYINEFNLGKKRIIVQPSAAKNVEGEPYFDPNDLTYYMFPEDMKDGNIIKEIDMSLRTAEHNAGLQDMLNTLSSRCGFGENHYKFENGSIATATQVISENSTLFRTIKKHEIILESVLKELCQIILRLGNTYMHMGLNEDVEISIDFDDSIIEDKTTDFQRDMQLLNAGIMNDWEFRAKWMNEDEATAKAALPKMEDMTTEEQDEVE